MVDLQGQLEPIKSDVLNRFETILEEASFINGGAVSQFQKELETYLGVKHVIPLCQRNRCTANRNDGAWFKTRR